MAERFESAPLHPPDGEWYARITTPRPGSASLGKALKLFAAVAIALIALNLYAPAPPTIIERIFASAILASLALPVWLWMSGADRTIPFMPFLTLIFAYYYALPVFLLKQYATGLFKPPIAEHFITLALGYSLLGLYCLFVGYYGPARWLFAPILPRLNLQWRDERVVKLVALMLGFGGLFVASSIARFLPESVAQIGVFAADLSMVGICTLVALQLAGRLDWITSAFVWGFLIPIRIAIGLGTGSAASGLIVGVAVAMMFASVRRSIPWKTLALGTVALFIIRPAEVPFRAATWGGRLSDASAIEKVRLYGDILYRITIGGAVEPQALIEFASLRLAQFTVFGEVIADTPALVPFWEGESYYPILFKPIPRFIMPDKPEEISGQTFGHRYALISARNVGTSINLPQIVELYGNFGLTGVIAGMFIFGLIYRLLIEVYVHPGMGLGALVGGVYISSKLLDVGSAASMVFGGIPLSIIFVALIHLFIQFAEVDATALDVTLTD
jgi:hypothetical protein